MTTFEKLQADVKEAMRSKNNVMRDCLRSLISEIKNQTVNAGKALNEAVVISCIKKAVKMHNDSIEQFTANSREDLASKEQEELSYLSAYLPKMMTEDEVKAAVDSILCNVESIKKNFGVVMRMLPAEADKKIASAYLKTLLK